MSINNFMQKIKQFIESERGKDFLIVVIIILMGFGSFELGRLSKDNDNSGIKIEYPDGTINQQANIISTKKNALNIPTSQNSTGKNFFASNRGSKYYPLGCSGGKSIKQENRIYFETKEEAERAGYSLSSGCM